VNLDKKDSVVDVARVIPDEETNGDGADGDVADGDVAEGEGADGAQGAEASVDSDSGSGDTAETNPSAEGE
jgi:hypothetical protein